MDDNVCKGCIYDLTDKVETDVEKFNIILDNCCNCKRGKLKEFQDAFPDLYKAEEIIAFNSCIRVFRSSQTYISEEVGKRYLHNVTATYANNRRKEYRKLLLKTGKMGKEYVICFGARCYVYV